MEPLNGPEQRIGQHERPVGGSADTFMTAFVSVYHALERLPHEQRRRVIAAVQALLPSDPNAAVYRGLISPEQEEKEREWQRINAQAGIQGLRR
jgi:hypothetical protein